MRKAFFQLHFAVFLAGFTGILGYLIQLNGLLLIFYRMLITIIILYIASIIIKKPFKLKKVYQRDINIIGLLLAAHWFCFYESIKLSNISVAVICLSATSAFTAILEPIIHKKKINYIELILGICCMIGVYIIFKSKTEFGWGIFVGVLCAFLASLYTIFNKKYAQKIRPITLLYYQLKIGALYTGLILLIILFYYQFNNDLYHFIPTSLDIFWLILLSVFCTILLQQLNIASLQHLSAFTNSLVFNLETIYSIFFAFILFNEYKQFNTEFYVGVTIIFISIFIQKIYEYLNFRKRSF